VGLWVSCDYSDQVEPLLADLESDRLFPNLGRRLPYRPVVRTILAFPELARKTIRQLDPAPQPGKVRRTLSSSTQT